MQDYAYQCRYFHPTGVLLGCIKIVVMSTLQRQTPALRNKHELNPMMWNPLQAARAEY